MFTPVFLKKCLHCGEIAEASAAVCAQCGGTEFTEPHACVRPYHKFAASRLTPKGREIYERAYGGDAQAMCEYGNLLTAEEEGAQGDLEEGYAWYLCAAQNGCAEGFYRAGLMHRNGDLLWEENGDPKKAMRLFLEGAKLGHAGCMFMLGDGYHTGYGVKRSDARAFRCFNAAAEAGDPKAMLWAARCYLEGGCGFPQDSKKAEALYERANARHFMYRDLRAAYLAGEGFPQDAARAEEMGEKYLEELLWLYTADPQTDVTCGYAWLIGQEYLDRGENEAAIEWFRRAMEHGDVMGKIELLRLKRV